MGHLERKRSRPSKGAETFKTGSPSIIKRHLEVQGRNSKSYRGTRTHATLADFLLKAAVSSRGLKILEKSRGCWWDKRL